MTSCHSTRDRTPRKAIWLRLRLQWNLTAIALAVSLLAVGLQLPLVFVTRFLIDTAIPSRRVGMLDVVIICLFAFMLAKGLTDVIHGYVGTLLRERTTLDLQMFLLRHLHSLGLPYIHESSSDYLSARVMADTASAASLPGGVVIPLVSDFLTLIAALIMIAALQWQLACLALIAVPAMIAYYRATSPRLRLASEHLQEAISSSFTRYHEALDNMELIKAFQTEEREASIVTHSLAHKRQSALRLSILTSLATSAAAFISGCGVLVVLGVGGRMVMEGRITLGTLIAFNLLIGYMFTPIQSLMTSLATLQTSLTAVARLDQIMSAPPRITDPSKPICLPRPVERIEFDNVSFTYSNDAVALRDVSLAAFAGQTIALVGANGAGKSTLARLIPRLYDPCQGAVLLNGVDLRSLRQSDLRGITSLVPQESVIIPGTIRDNIFYGSGNVNAETLDSVLWVSTADEVLAHLHAGWNTSVGERGVRLSGGERQRIAIARALLRCPSILILDEATSQIDSLARARIYDRLNSLLVQSVRFVVDHRMTVVKSADLIIVLDQGRVIDLGRHRELMERCARYCSLFSEAAAQYVAAVSDDAIRADASPLSRLVGGRSTDERIAVNVALEA